MSDDAPAPKIPGIIMIVGGDSGSRRGRPTLFDEPLTKKLEILLTDEQWKDLETVAEEETAIRGSRVTKTMIVRDAVNTFVADFRETKVFKTHKKGYLPE